MVCHVLQHSEETCIYLARELKRHVTIPLHPEGCLAFLSHLPYVPLSPRLAPAQPARIFRSSRI